MPEINIGLYPDVGCMTLFFGRSWSDRSIYWFNGLDHDFSGSLWYWLGQRIVVDAPRATVFKITINMIGIITLQVILGH